MVNQKVNVKLIDWEAKVDKTGKKNYARFKTESYGWMSAFETEVIEELKKCIGRTVAIDMGVSEDGKFKNIRAFNGIVREEFGGAKCVENMDNIRTIETIEEKQEMMIKDTRLASMCVSYAKDLACAKVIEHKDIKLHAVGFLKMIVELSM
jgi:hypothetical protein